MIKLPLLAIALGLFQLIAAERAYAAPPAVENTTTNQQVQSQSSDDQAVQTGSRTSNENTASSWPPYQPAKEAVAGELGVAFEVETEALTETLLDSLNEYYPQLTGKAYNVQLDASRMWWEEENAVGLFKVQMADAEQATFERKHGYPPTVLPIAMSAVVMVVHPDNPVVERGLSLAEVDAIFSETRHRGHSEVSLWGDVGLGGQWALRPIYKYRVTEINTLHDFFQRRVLNGGQFKTIATRESNSADVVDRIGGYENEGAVTASEGNTDAIGFVYLEDVRDTVAIVPIAAQNNETPVFPTAENVTSGRYPLRQHTSLYLTIPPDGALEPAQLELVKLIFSQQGQQTLKELNYTPMPKAAVREKLQSIGIRVE